MLNVPAELDGTYSLKLISSNGEIAYDVLGWLPMKKQFGLVR